MQNEYLRGPMLCVLCNIGNPDCRTSYFCRRKQRNGQRYPTRKSSAISIPGFGNGTVHSGIVRNGTDLVCMDNPQTEKTILIEQMRAME